MRVYHPVCYSQQNDPAHYMKIFLPDEGDSFPVFVYFHGGGLVHGNEDIPPFFPEYLTERGIAVVSAHYRMYPDAKFPDFLVDGASAIAWVKSEKNTYFKTEQIYVGGSSAGGYISMMLCFDEQYLTNAGVNPSDISGYVFDAGQPTTHFQVLRERGYDKNRQIIDDAAPIYHIDETKTYPPMLILIADRDMANRYEQTQLMIDTLKWNGHEDIEYYCLHSTHCRYTSRFDENCESILGKKIFNFIKRVEAKGDAQ